MYPFLRESRAASLRRRRRPPVMATPVALGGNREGLAGSLTGGSAGRTDTADGGPVTAVGTDRPDAAQPRARCAIAGTVRAAVQRDVAWPSRWNRGCTVGSVVTHGVDRAHRSVPFAPPAIGDGRNRRGRRRRSNRAGCRPARACAEFERGVRRLRRRAARGRGELLHRGAAPVAARGRRRRGRRGHHDAADVLRDGQRRSCTPAPRRCSPTSIPSTLAISTRGGRGRA